MFNDNGSNVSGKDLVNLSDILETQKEEIYKEGIIFFWKKEQDNYLVFPDFSAEPLEIFEGSLDSQMFSSKCGSILFVQGMIERRTGIFLNKWLISSEIERNGEVNETAYCTLIVAMMYDGEKMQIGKELIFSITKGDKYGLFNEDYLITFVTKNKSKVTAFIPILPE